MPARLDTLRQDEIGAPLAVQLAERAVLLESLTYFRGRVAMAAILRALGVRKGDEVLIQAFTCIAVPEAVQSIGAVPRYVDVAAGLPNMDPADLRRKITPATRAVVIQHSFGLPADVHGLCDVATDAGIPVIEDCAHTVASSVDGRLVGSFGAAAFFSYESSKPLFAGIGGSAIAQSAELEEKLRAGYADYHQPAFATQLQIESMFLAHRLVYRPSTYWSVRKIYRAFVAAGLIRGNYNRLENDEADGPADDFRRSMGSRQRKSLRRAVARIADQTLHRRWVAGEYRSGIARNGVAHFPVFSGADPAFGRYPLLVEDKRQWVERARERRVELADFYDTPVHPLRGAELRRVGYEPASCPNAEWVSSRVVSLPTGSQVTSGQVQRAIEYFSR